VGPLAPAAAVHLLQRALDLTDPSDSEHRRILPELAVSLLHRGELVQARALFDEAHGLYERLQAHRDLRRVNASLRAAGVRRGVRGRHRPRLGWQALTQTELAVAGLVAERLSNPEIAQRLFLSRRTVQTHVSHALAKLEVPSRARTRRRGAPPQRDVVKNPPDWRMSRVRSVLTISRFE
jgi:DNA-binding CsgD family transcriptional regulator